jgi:NitT/TauT family transport system substrate-binding protein
VIVVRLVALAAAIFFPLALHAEEPIIRIAVLKFGTAAWEIDTIREHRLAPGVDIAVREVANNEAAKVALEGGAVDVIVSDWLWAARQRATGDDLVFVPFSTTVGALMVPNGSPIRDLADLRDKAIGVAGGPLDKSWLLFRAEFLHRFGQDATDSLHAVFAAPPLLNAELRSGAIDAVLTYWNFAAELEAHGARRLIDVADIVRELSGGGVVLPMLGYVFHASWASQHGNLLARFLDASRRAKELLAVSDAEWQRLRPLLGTDDDAVAARLAAGFRAGIPKRWGSDERGAAMTIYGELAELGGAELTGGADVLDERVFWSGLSY